MLRKVAFSPWILSLLVFVFAAPVFAQTTASIQGTVTDQSGAAVAGATVTVKNTSLGVDRTSQTNSVGSYEVPALPPGIYSVQIQMNGFATQLVKSLVLEVDKNSVQNFGLKVANNSEVVTVEATAPTIESTTMTVGQTINQRTVQEIPLNGRHFVDLGLLIPGSVTPPQNGFLTAPIRGQGSLAFNSAGSREDEVNFMINGINLNDMLQNQITFQPTINTVAEFKVDNSTYSAEYGRNSGSIVNIATRSGSDQYHGEAYDYLRNEWFDARNAFDPLTVSNPTTGAVSPNPISPFKRNQFGGDFGGPIKKGKTTFFLSYEGLRQRQGLALATPVLPDTGATSRATVLATGGPVANALLGILPHANGVIGAGPAFLGSATAPVNIDQGTADVDHKISDADQLHGYYVYQKDSRIEPGATGGASIPGFGDTRLGTRQLITLNETHVFSSSFVNEARLGANRVLIDFSPNTTISPASLGLANALGPNEQFMPFINLAFLSNTTFGAETGFPQGRGDTTVSLGDTVSWIHSRHSFKFGVEGRDFRNNNFNGDPGSLTYNSFTSFENDTPDVVTRTVGNVANRINEGALDFFAMDSYKWKPYLTFELGLRYAWNMTPSEAEGRFANLIPGPGNGSLLEQVSQPYAQNSKNFQPRVGFSWDLFHNGNTVLRGGYAYQTDQPISGFVTGLSSNPPFALPIRVTATPISGLAAQFNGIPQTISPQLINPDFRNADIQSWNLNIQHQVGHSLGLMVGYFGNKGTHLEIDRDINQFAVLGSPQTGGLNPTRPFVSLSPNSPILPGTVLGNSLTEHDSDANSNYNALWFTANQRVSHGLQFNVSYTYSHALDDASRSLNGVVVPDSTNVSSGYGSSDFDARHRFVANAIYDLPFKGNRVVSGWEVAPIVTLQSGNPFTIVNASTTITGVASVTPILAGPLVVSGNPFGQWVLPTNFADPTKQTTLGNLGRNSIVGPDFKDLDLALAKNTKLTERMNLQIRCDAFDLFNHPNFGQPSRTLSSLTSKSFATITSTRFPTGDAGSSRQLQLAMKLQF
jgi:hypothetical protein